MMRIERPDGYRQPGPGEESVWDYPRPPRVEPLRDEVIIEFAGIILARSTGCYRVLETASPPTIYIPPRDIRMEYLRPVSKVTFCEWKGVAQYWTVDVDGRLAEHAAWGYPSPSFRFRSIRDHLAFYATKMDACSVGGDLVLPQAGDFYGGWITSKIIGPFKGEPGTLGW